MSRAGTLMFLAVLIAPCGSADGGGTGPFNRTSAAAGLEVYAVSFGDLNDLVTSSATGRVRADEFTVTAVFFGGVSLPLADRWSVKLEYGRLLGSISTPGFFGTSTFDLRADLPTVSVMYTLSMEETYGFRAGAGVGYRRTVVTRSLGTLEDRFLSSGLGVGAELEGATSLGDNLFATIGLQLRWESAGELRNDAGVSAGNNATGRPASMGGFGGGIRFGVLYAF